MSAKKTAKTRKPKSIGAKVITQLNYFHRKRLNLSVSRLHTAVGVKMDSGSTVMQYLRKIKAAGYVQDLEKDGFMKITKTVPKDALSAA